MCRFKKFVHDAMLLSGVGGLRALRIAYALFSFHTHAHPINPLREVYTLGVNQCMLGPAMGLTR